MRAFISSFALLIALQSSAWAVNPAAVESAATGIVPATTNMTANTPASATPAAVKKLSPAEELAKDKAQQEAKIKTLVKDQASRLQQLEKANLDALTQNQELQLKNDNLAVQVQVLQSESSAQMFLYGAATLAGGVLLGFFIAGYIYTKRRRQW